MTRSLARLALVGVLLGVAIDIGSAATLGLSAREIEAGSEPVVECGDTSGTAISYTTDGAGAVTDIVVSGLPAGCVGGQLSVTVLDGGSVIVARGGPMVVPVGPSVSVTVTPNPQANTVAGADLVIVGP